MGLRAAGRFRLCHFPRVVVRGTLLVATLAIASGMAVTLRSSPASAASPTDTIYVYDGSGPLADQPLPAGTPDIVTPLGSELFSVCGSADEVSSEQGYYGVAGLCVPLVPVSGLDEVDVVNAGVAGIFVASSSFGGSSTCFLGVFVNEDYIALISPTDC